MSISDLKRELAALPRERQDELAAYLLHLRLERDLVWRTEMARRIDDKTPENWVSLGEWKQELNQTGTTNRHK